MTAWFLVVFSLQHAHTHPTACSQGLLSLHAVITLIMSGSAGYIIVSNYKKRRIFIAQQVCTSAAAVFFCAAHRLRRYHILRSASMLHETNSKLWRLQHEKSRVHREYPQDFHIKARRVVLGLAMAERHS